MTAFENMLNKSPVPCGSGNAVCCCPKNTSQLLLLCSQLTAAEQAAKDEEPAMDLSATFRNSMRLSMTGANTPVHAPFYQIHADLQCVNTAPADAECCAKHHAHVGVQLPEQCLSMLNTPVFTLPSARHGQLQSSVRSVLYSTCTPQQGTATCNFDSRKFCQSWRPCVCSGVLCSYLCVQSL